MRCQACGFENASGIKFCGECGAPLKPKCSSCGVENAPGVKFCGDCGQRLGESLKPSAVPDPRTYTPKHLAEKILTSRSALEGERKQVTVLFADVKGSMDLSESIDPEDWHRIMERFFAILSDGVHRFEGTVNQYTGDGIMALFGAPIAHEDHAARACYAALALQEDLRRYANELRLQKGINFSVRMGLNSGEVVVGRIGDDLRMDYTALGHTASLGARMEQIAAPDRAYLTEHTAKLVEGLVALQDLGKVAVKGVKEPLEIYDLQGIGKLHTKLEVSRARGFSKFVGRDREMALLDDALERALAGSGQVVGIVADPGVGKSRLCYEFVERCRARDIFVDEGHCPAHGKTVPYLPILEIFRSYFGITEPDSSTEARRKIAGTLLLLDESFRDLMPLVTEFLGVSDPQNQPPRMDPEAKQWQLLAFLRKLTHAISDQQPFVVLIDDLHWIDRASEAFVAAFAEAVSERRVLFLVNFRPEYSGAEWTKRSYYHQLPLLPLGPEATAELLDDLLGTDEALAPMRALIHKRTGGNPFFIEELALSLAESGALQGSRGHYHLARAVEGIEIPATVQAVLAARIDRLADKDKELLQTASVIGKSFPEPILRRVADLSDAELAASLSALRQSEFLYDEAIYPEASYAFKHPLTQEVAYNSQLSERRHRTHAAVARALQGLYPDKLDERAAEIAYHWENAGERLEAARWSRRAAEWAEERDPREALRLWRKIPVLVKPLRASVDCSELGLRARTGALSWGWRFGCSEAEAKQMLDEGKRLAAELDDPSLVIPLIWGYANIRFFAGDLREGMKRGREAVDLADRAGNRVLCAGTRVALGNSYLHLGQLREALVILEEACRLSEDDPSMGGEVFGGFVPHLVSTFLVGMTLTELGRLEEAALVLDRAEKLSESIHSAQEMRWILGQRSRLATRRGEVSAALERGARSLELAEAVGTPFDRAWAQAQLGYAEVLAGRWVEAAASLECGLAIVRENRTGVFMEPEMLAARSRALLGLRLETEARAFAQEGIAVAKQIGTRLWEAYAHLTLAHVLLRTERRPAAERIGLELAAAMALIEETGGRVHEPHVHIERARLAELCGEEAARDRELRAAYGLFVEMGATGYAERIAPLLAESAR